MRSRPASDQPTPRSLPPSVHDDQFVRISAYRNRPATGVLDEREGVGVDTGWIVEAVEAEGYPAGDATRPVTFRSTFRSRARSQVADVVALRAERTDCTNRKPN